VTIEDWRNRIDEIDLQLLELLNRRAACSIEIGKLKHQMSLSIISPEREEAVIARALEQNPGPLDADAIQRLFAAILEESKRLQARAAEQP
jgi:chorismate mutase